MSGARVEITKDTLGPALKRGLREMQGEGRTLMLDDIGEYLLRSTRERGERQVSPDGIRWKPLEPSYRAWKAKKRPGVPILRFDFHMQGDQLSHQVVGADLLVGTNAVYGAAHQFAIGPRPWLGLSLDDETEIENIALDHLSGMFSAD